jgi:hypothetical protein
MACTSPACAVRNETCALRAHRACAVPARPPAGGRRPKRNETRRGRKPRAAGGARAAGGPAGPRRLVGAGRGRPPAWALIAKCWSLRVCGGRRATTGDRSGGAGQRAAGPGRVEARLRADRLGPGLLGRVIRACTVRARWGEGAAGVGTVAGCPPSITRLSPGRSRPRRGLFAAAGGRTHATGGHAQSHERAHRWLVCWWCSACISCNRTTGGPRPSGGR